MKKKISICLALVLALACVACGDDKEQTATTAPDTATEAPAEVTEEPVEEPEETAEAEEPETEPEEETTEEAASYDVDELAALFKSFTGIRGTAGDSLKMCVVADSCLAYAQEKELYLASEADKEGLKSAVQEAFGRLKKKQQKEFQKNINEDAMPMITDSFQDPTAYAGEFEDSGLGEAWNAKLDDPHIQDDWAVLWEALFDVL